MDQHRRFPGSVFVVLAVLAIPSLLFGLLHSAENADKCVQIAQAKHDGQHVETGLKCE